MIPRSRRWAAPAATALLVAVAGCGGHADEAAGPGSPSSAATAPDTSLSPAPSSSPLPSPSGAATAAPQTPKPGSYDDNGGAAPAPHNQRPVLNHLPGARSRRCVPVGEHTAVRSGDLAMGDFAQARAEYLAVHGAYDAQPSHFYVIPQSRSARRASVTLTRVQGGAPPIEVSSDHLEDAAQWRYFPISVKVTRPGTWRFTVQVGDSTGCFVARFAS